MTTKSSETHVVEWKESWRDEYLTWPRGCANADGGTPLIGMNDKGEPVGAQDTVTEFRALARRTDGVLPRLLSGELPVNGASPRMEVP